MFVRVFCTPSDSALGRLTWTFIDMVQLHHDVCLVPPPGPNAHVNLENLPDTWERFRPLFAAPITGDYANVVASNDPAEWERLWTANVSNLVLTTIPPPARPHAIYGKDKFSAVVLGGPQGEIDLIHQWITERPGPVVISLEAEWDPYDQDLIELALKGHYATVAP